MSKDKAQHTLDTTGECDSDSDCSNCGLEWYYCTGCTTTSSTSWRDNVKMQSGPMISLEFSTTRGIQCSSLNIHGPKFQFGFPTVELSMVGTNYTQVPSYMRCEEVNLPVDFHVYKIKDIKDVLSNNRRLRAGESGIVLKYHPTKTPLPDTQFPEDDCLICELKSNHIIMEGVTFR